MSKKKRKHVSTGGGHKRKMRKSIKLSSETYQKLLQFKINERETIESVILRLIAKARGEKRTVVIIR